MHVVWDRMHLWTTRFHCTYPAVSEFFKLFFHPYASALLFDIQLNLDVLSCWNCVQYAWRRIRHLHCFWHKTELTCTLMLELCAIRLKKKKKKEKKKKIKKFQYIKNKLTIWQYTPLTTTQQTKKCQKIGMHGWELLCLRWVTLSQKIPNFLSWICLMAWNLSPQNHVTVHLPHLR